MFNLYCNLDYHDSVSWLDNGLQAKVTGIPGVSHGFEYIGNGRLLGAPIFVLTMIVIFMAAFYVFKYTHFGRYIYALGGNEEATRLAGINVDRIKLSVYIVSGILGALATVILTARLSSA